MFRLQAPAKLNLYLRILGKRVDGFHELETVFERLDLVDELTFDASPRGLELTCTDPALSCGEDNLVVKAARLLQQVTGTSQGARIHLTKRIPVAAGLGGGSSDAATTLNGLNRLWGIGFDQPSLLQLAAELGSDIAFFLTGSPFAIGRGRGERCEPVGASCVLAQVLVVPAERLSTKTVYASAQFDLTASKPSSTMIVHALHNGSLGELAQGLWNDLEPEAIRRCPVISVIQSRLRDLGCLGVCVSGSGTSVFGLCADAARAREIAQRLRQESVPWRIEIIHTQPTLVATS
ncbi:MAG: 4-(cytidine 5'-diphospho)-2-C-methyl-D-erythritol kinase [Candidatus Omnitrophica bacterium]|nr:4-(cytidine 5'-diphospho)-2-C-methyl-D-erythritol kinase [Candidatus Omnitrophota bacterium]